MQKGGRELISCEIWVKAEGNNLVWCIKALQVKFFSLVANCQPTLYVSLPKDFLRRQNIFPYAKKR